MCSPKLLWDTKCWLCPFQQCIHFFSTLFLCYPTISPLFFLSCFSFFLHYLVCNRRFFVVIFWQCIKNSHTISNSYVWWLKWGSLSISLYLFTLNLTTVCIWHFECKCSCSHIVWLYSLRGEWVVQISEFGLFCLHHCFCVTLLLYDGLSLLLSHKSPNKYPFPLILFVKKRVYVY